MKNAPEGNEGHKGRFRGGGSARFQDRNPSVLSQVCPTPEVRFNDFTRVCVAVGLTFP